MILIAGFTACGDRSPPLADVRQVDWPRYGGDDEGTKYSPIAQIDRSNVDRLTIAWSVQTGDHDALPPGRFRFETVPLALGGVVYVSTPLNRILALDATTGATRWSFDPGIDPRQDYAEGLTSRGLAAWVDPSAPPEGVCARRIFLATVDRRLFALDAAVGQPCPGFGVNGVVALQNGTESSPRWSVTSPPAIVGDVVIVGSAVNKTMQVPAPSGMVRAYDARTGSPRWTFDPLRTGATPSETGFRGRLGGGNVWSVMAADAARDMVFLPTASAAPDHLGIDRPGANRHANSVVALQASTGGTLWAWQAIRHDLWDYDIAAQPLLLQFPTGGKEVPAVVVATKTAMLFVLDRETGEPLIPVVERPVPESDVPGEIASPTQPFPTAPLPLVGTALTPDSAFGVTETDRVFCQASMRALRNEGVFTPPSLEGTLVWPGPWGGINWGGTAWDPDRQVLVTSLTRLAMVVQLHDRHVTAGGSQPLRPGEQFLALRGSAYAASRRPLVAPSGIPCTPPPWTELVAVDLENGLVKWRVPLGNVPSLATVPGSKEWGALAFGGPLLTAGGLVFIGAAQDDRIRAFDIDTGELLWEHELPAGGQANAISYSQDGRQYIVIVAGGRAGIGSSGDWVVAFAIE